MDVDGNNDAAAIAPNAPANAPTIAPNAPTNAPAIFRFDFALAGEHLGCN